MSNNSKELQDLLQEIIFKISDKYNSSQTANMLTDAETIKNVILGLNKNEQKVKENDICSTVRSYHGIGFIIERLLLGNKVARKGWNGKDMYIYHVPAAEYPAQRNKLETMMGSYKNDMVPYGAYLALKCADGTVVPWLPSQTDLLATDWYFIPK